MDLMQNKIYCTFKNTKVLVKECMDCDKLYDCDNNWCDNHKCINCEHKIYGLCDGEV